MLVYSHLPIPLSLYCIVKQTVLMLMGYTPINKKRREITVRSQFKHTSG